ncbi:hypothetical protein OQA88_3714 [Cercophora sp. LCS_1]
MTLHAAQCSRALHRQITSDSVWISDATLATAFDRYCLVSRTWRRKASSVPGPLESRRRLGKRQLGDLTGLHLSPSTPAWAFSGPLNLSQWNWQPPQPASKLEEKRSSPQVEMRGSELPALFRWLSQAATAEQPSSFDIGTHSPRQISLQADLDSFLWSIQNAPDSLVNSETTNICSKFQQAIFLGELLPSAIYNVSTQIWAGLDQRFGPCSLSRTLCEAIITGATTSNVFKPAFLPWKFWRLLLFRMSSLEVDDALYCLFGRVMSATRHIEWKGTDPAILAVLGRFLRSWASPTAVYDTKAERELQLATASCERIQNLLAGFQSQDAATGDIVRRAKIELEQARSSLALADAAVSKTVNHIRGLSAALGSAKTVKRGRLLHGAQRLMFEMAHVPSTRLYELRYNWLSVLAHMPVIRERTLTQSIARLSGALWPEPLGATDLCSLMVAQWASRGYLFEQADMMYQKHYWHSTANDETAIASLATTVFYSDLPNRRRLGLLHSLSRILGRLGRSEELIESFRALSHVDQVSRSLLHTLSATTRDRHVALRLQQLCQELWLHDGRGWKPSPFTKLAEQIVLDPSIPTSTIWQALRIERMGGAQHWPDKPRNRRVYEARRVAVVSSLATAFSEAPHLPTRVAFRHVSQCVRFLEKRGDVPTPVIEALYRVVTKDLRQGLPGHGTRLQWFLDVLRRNYGSDLSQAVHRPLRGWRFKVARAWELRGKVGSTRKKQ